MRSSALNLETTCLTTFTFQMVGQLCFFFYQNPKVQCSSSGGSWWPNAPLRHFLVCGLNFSGPPPITVHWNNPGLELNVMPAEYLTVNHVPVTENSWKWIVKKYIFFLHRGCIIVRYTVYHYSVLVRAWTIKTFLYLKFPVFRHFREPICAQNGCNGH